MTGSLSVAERIEFLKTVTFFQGMTIDQLKELASICEEESIPEDTSIFKEGEPSGVLYIVVHGRVAIEREGERKDSVVRLATMDTRSSFGEMSLFDNSPRSTNAKTIEDTMFLKLRVEPVVALMRQYPDMLLELIKVLSQRLREVNDQVTRLTRSMPRQLHQLYDKLENVDNK
jgi:CRP/FNR family transcriptional regulator, cyclic AMP receptor protein